MTTLSQAALWLINQGAQEALGPKPRYWRYGESPIPRNEYHQVVILVVGKYSVAVRKVLAENFEEQGRAEGFRLLKVQPIGGEVQFGGAPAYLFTGFVASDTWPKTANQLSAALKGAPVVFDSQPVNLAEAASLDALWVASGELEKEVQDIQVTHGLQLNYWPLLGLAALVVSAGFLLHTVITKATQGARA